MQSFNLFVLCIVNIIKMSGMKSHPASELVKRKTPREVDHRISDRQESGGRFISTIDYGLSFDDDISRLSRLNESNSKEASTDRNRGVISGISPVGTNLTAVAIPLGPESSVRDVLRTSNASGAIEGVHMGAGALGERNQHFSNINTGNLTQTLSASVIKQSVCPDIPSLSANIDTLPVHHIITPKDLWAGAAKEMSAKDREQLHKILGSNNGRNVGQFEVGDDLIKKALRQADAIKETDGTNKTRSVSNTFSLIFQLRFQVICVLKLLYSGCLCPTQNYF